MPYVIPSDFTGILSAALLADALDDDRDGQPDEGVLDAIIAAAALAADACLAARYLVPFADPAPPVVRAATLMFACESIFRRRGGDDRPNPFSVPARHYRDQLERVGRGEMPLDAVTLPAMAPGAAVTEAVRIDGTTL